MRNLLKIKALDINENDNELTAMAKGGVKGWLVGTLYLGALVVTTAAIGNYMKRKGASNGDR